MPDPRAGAIGTGSRGGSPRISVVTPSYNQAPFLEGTLRSVLEQGYANLEYIVMDGGSTDGSADIIRRYEDRLAYWVSAPDEGQSAAINAGFERATGEILCWLNSDDVLLPGALDAVAAAFAEHPQAAAIVGYGDLVDPKGRVLYTAPVPDLSFEALLDWTGTSHFVQAACFFTREAWRVAGPLDTELDYAMDLDLWLKIARHAPLVRLDRKLARSTLHADAKTMAEPERSLAETALVLARHGGEAQARAQLFELADRVAVVRRTISRVGGRRGLALAARLYARLTGRRLSAGQELLWADLDP